MGDDLVWEPAWQLARRIRAKELSPVELMDAVLDRIDRVDPLLHAFLSLDPEQSRARARQAEQAVARGDELGPLHGIPIGVKDMVDTVDFPTTSGSLAFADRRPQQDAVLVQRLRAAGAIIIGKTNTPEFGAYIRTLNLLGPETVNPWDTTRSAGASSGGSGAAVAAGLGPIAIGTDGGGSTRLPAALNGVFGLYPTRGRIPAYSTLFCNPTSGPGPIARDVRDAAIVFNVIADEAPERADLDAGVAGVRVAWSPDFGRVRVHQQAVVDAVHHTAMLLKDLGASYDEPDLHLPDVFDTLAPIRDYTLAATARLAVPEGVPTLVELFAELRSDPAQWAKVTPMVQSLDPSYVDYVTSISPAVRNRPVDRPEDVLQRYDLLASPTISRVAFVCEDGIAVPSWTEYTYIANIIGYPAVSIPAGFVDGLPVGLQLIARPGEEALLLRTARSLEQAAPWAHHRPPIG